VNVAATNLLDWLKSPSKNSCLAGPILDPRLRGMTSLGLETAFDDVIPAKAGIHEFSHRLIGPL